MFLVIYLKVAMLPDALLQMKYSHIKVDSPPPHDFMSSSFINFNVKFVLSTDFEAIGRKLLELSKIVYAKEASCCVQLFRNPSVAENSGLEICLIGLRNRSPCHTIVDPK